ncbi:MAG: type II secretion system F family protein [Solirubrobacterales bacterium]
MSGPAVAVAVLLTFAAAWELVAERGEDLAGGVRRLASRLTSGRVKAMAEAVLALGLARRLERAGMSDRLGPATVLGAKLAGTAAGSLCAAAAVPALPGRLGLVVTPLLAVAGFLAPDALLERKARLRRARLVAALPDALDVLSVGVAAGRSPAAVLGDLAGHRSGPLAAELALVLADLEGGAGQAAALAGLRQRVGGPELAALVASLERSRRHGSPLAEQLRRQSSNLRARARRRTEEVAARAAPKIQLVVALVLVPSVLLMILAAILAHSDELLGSLAG